MNLIGGGLPNFWISSQIPYKCDVLRDLAPFVQFKKREGAFLSKFLIFAKKISEISNISGALLIYFLKLHTCLYLRNEFQVYSITLTNSWQGGVILWVSISKQTPEKRTQIRVSKTVPHRNYLYFVFWH